MSMQRVRQVWYYLARSFVLVLAALAFSSAPARPLHASPLSPPGSGAPDAFRPLAIGQTPVWNTFLGGSENDSTYSVAVDANGNVYVAGMSKAAWQGTKPPVRGYSGGGGDALVAKLSPSGTLLWHTFLGGSDFDTALGIALDASANVYVAGSSFDTWQGTSSPKRPYSFQDAFVAKLNSSDGALLWNTFLGGALYDDVNSIVTDGQGNVYVTGESDATWQGTKPPKRDYGSLADAMVAKLSPDGDLLWNMFLGGSGNDFSSGMAIDVNDDVYVAGTSHATWQGTSKPVRDYTSGDDVYVAKLTPDGGLDWNTFLGDSGDDAGRAIAVDSDANAYVTGESDVTWGSPVRHFSGSANRDGFAAKLNSNGGLTWNTFLGSSGIDESRGIAVDSGNVYVAGSSDATWGSPIRPYSNLFDTYVATLNPDGSLAWNTFLGGSGDDHTGKAAVVSHGYLYMTGWSSDTWGSPVRPYTSGDDGFVTKIDIQWHIYLPLISK